jgi:methyl coenzyme M reductase subunit C-like uncharacterized protein (methanogenesis marker protein 7)
MIVAMGETSAVHIQYSICIEISSYLSTNKSKVSMVELDNGKGKRSTNPQKKKKKKP